MKSKLVLLVLVSLLVLNFCTKIQAEPWINASDLYLRADIETLSDIGIISVPITSYPLMWAGIIKNIDETNIEEVPVAFKSVYWRVKKAGKRALSNRPIRLLKASVSSSEQVFRSFGDNGRGKNQLSASSARMGSYFAWNVQLNRVTDPLDGDKQYYDGSYIAGIYGNWIASIGSVEKWWGASWDSANLLSNNARAPIGLTINRNYSAPFDTVILNWLGEWSVTGFVSQLDIESPQVLEQPYFSGASISFKPLEALETSFRITTISGGTISGYNFEAQAKQIVAADFRWRLPNFSNQQSLPTNLYLSVTDEGQSTSYTTLLFGLSSSFNIIDNRWRFYIEATDTLAGGNSSNPEYNTTYEDGFYRQGYRIKQRAIGSTFDNDSKVYSLGVFGWLGRYQTLAIKYQNINLNQQIEPSPLDGFNSINRNSVKANRIEIKWDYRITRNNKINLLLDYSDQLLDGKERQTEKYRIGVGWSYLL